MANSTEIIQNTYSHIAATKQEEVSASPAEEELKVISAKKIFLETNLAYSLSRSKRKIFGRVTLDISIVCISTFFINDLYNRTIKIKSTLQKMSTKL